MRVSATAPTRVDLAGGTLDVYPLYLFEGGGLTVTTEHLPAVREALMNAGATLLPFRIVSQGIHLEVRDEGSHPCPHLC
jgi:hypothetical protein